MENFVIFGVRETSYRRCHDCDPNHRQTEGSVGMVDAQQSAKLGGREMSSLSFSFSHLFHPQDIWS